MAQSETDVPRTAGEFADQLPGFSVKQYAPAIGSGVMALATADYDPGIEVVISYRNAFDPVHETGHTVGLVTGGDYEQVHDGDGLTAAEAVARVIEVAEQEKERRNE